ncbi:MAG: hypothetical protein K0S47_3326 [Herbinix sp.]|jgi:hypothetical protein|nr:hypothetical protein [Herbinix sp.]
MELKQCNYEIIRGSRKLKYPEEFHCPAEGLDLCVYKKDSPISDGLLLEKMKYLVLEAQVLEEHSMCFQVSVYRTSPQPGVEADLRMIFGLLPGINLTVPVSLDILNSQNLFPPRTIGRLKMTVFGKPIRLEEVGEIHVTTIPFLKEHEVKIRNLYFTDTEPEIILEDVKLMDGLGQWIPKQWSNKMADREACNTYLKGLREKADHFDYQYPYPDWDQYGGWLKKPMTRTGWFHTEYDGNRWWLVDPEGNAFVSAGLDCLRPGNETRVDPVRPWCSFIPDDIEIYGDALKTRSKNNHMEFCNYGIVNLIDAFGPDQWWDVWAKILKMFLYEWGFNTIGNWSDPKFIRYAQMPYVIPLDTYSPKGYPSTAAHIFRDFPDVYAKEFKDNAEEYALGLEQFKEDPYMIGYFMRNEPAWAFVYELNIAEEMLANPTRTASKIEFITRLKDKYNDIATFNVAWKLELKEFEDLYQPLYHACDSSEHAKRDLTEFSKEMITLYVQIPSKACKKVDKNHLNLGMRYAYITDSSLLSGYENFDVFSINSYQFSPYKEVEQLGKLLDMPVMIGEFHQGALDMGLTAHGIKAVIDQTDRGKGYRYYVEQGSLSKFFLGAHYFQLNDQSCLGRFDGENYQIGVLDVCMQEYIDMMEAVKICHSTLYQVVEGSIPAFDDKPDEITPIHF